MGVIVLVVYILAVLAIYSVGGLLIGLTIPMVKDTWESGYWYMSIVIVLLLVIVIGCLVVVTWLNIEIVRMGSLKEIVTFLNSGLY